MIRMVGVYLLESNHNSAVSFESNVTGEGTNVISSSPLVGVLVLVLLVVVFGRWGWLSYEALPNVRTTIINLRRPRTYTLYGNQQSQT